ncbi:recombinase family protein [Kribbella sp.]|uniref:recombinase family protein n=1 Tax=Kribbella sp. TaxID=1871183 RepID=UPI002D599822|nr:recombinase family protein [Kribbella sp.]HZX05682.1 recombinase family protein [Kribbella sp.]
MRTAVYLRMSRDDTGEGRGIDRQREDCEQLVERRGWIIAEVLPENDTSASGKARRPQFDRLVQMIRAREVEAVVAWSLDRLTRNRRDTVALIEAAQEAGTTIALCRGSDMDMSTPAGRLAAEILASVARNEIEVKSDRQRRAAEQAATNGQRTGSRRPFGYTSDMKPHRHEAKLVRAAYADLLSGKPLAAIAREWREAGISTPQNRRGEHSNEPGRWTGQVLSRALRKPVYAALRPGPATRNKWGAYTGDLVPATWKPLVSEETWRAAQDLMDDPDRRTSGGARALLTGVALCGTCGLTVQAGGAATTQPYAIYRCQSMKHISRRGDVIDAYVSRVMLARLSRKDAAELLHDGDRPDVGELRAEANALRRRIDLLATNLDIDERTLARRDKALREKLTGVEAQLVDAGRVDALGPLVTADDIAAVWNGLGVDRQRAVVDLLMTIRIPSLGRGVRGYRVVDGEVVIDPETVEIEWRQG